MAFRQGAYADQPVHLILPLVWYGQAVTGAAAIGQGLCTALAQICASELGIRPEDVTVLPGDTSGVSLGLGAFASRQTVTAGNSVLLAARGRRQGQEAR